MPAYSHDGRHVATIVDTCRRTMTTGLYGPRTSRKEGLRDRTSPLSPPPPAGTVHEPGRDLKREKEP